MKTFTIGYAIHNKGYMIDKIIDGLVHSIPSEYDVKYTFIFDGCTDNSIVVFERERGKLKNTGYMMTDNIFQLKTNNILINDFDTDFLIIFQDDMVLTDSHFLENILNIYKEYGDRLGLLGCRDGFDEAFSNMSGSRFSASCLRKEVLASGEYREKMMVNIGPIVFTRKLVELMGCFDEIYTRGTYEEMEYSLKCTLRGLVTVVMGVDLMHNKFVHKSGGVAHTSQNILNDMYRINGKIFKDRWFEIAKI